MSLSYFPTHAHLMLRHTAQCSYKGGGYDKTEILSKEKEIEVPFFWLEGMQEEEGMEEEGEEQVSNQRELQGESKKIRASDTIPKVYPG